MNTPHLPNFSGQIPDDEQTHMIQKTAEYWRGVGNEIQVQAVTRAEEAAKQLIGLTATLQGLYFAIFAFSDFRKQVGAIVGPVPGNLILLLFFVPILLWLVSLYCATQVFIPQVRPGNLNDLSVSAWQDLRQAYGTVVEVKMRWLHRAYRWLVVSFATVLITSLLLLFLLPAPATGSTQIIIVTPTPTFTPITKP